MRGSRRPLRTRPSASASCCGSTRAASSRGRLTRSRRSCGATACGMFRVRRGRAARPAGPPPAAPHGDLPRMRNPRRRADAAGQDGDMVRYTHPGSLAYFNQSAVPLKGRPSFAGGLWGFVRGGPWVAAVLAPWAACSRVRDCISPAGANLGNHRFDQAVGSIITCAARARGGGRSSRSAHARGNRARAHTTHAAQLHDGDDAQPRRQRHVPACVPARRLPAAAGAVGHATHGPARGVPGPAQRRRLLSGVAHGHLDRTPGLQLLRGARGQLHGRRGRRRAARGLARAAVAGAEAAAAAAAPAACGRRGAPAAGVSAVVGWL